MAFSRTRRLAHAGARQRGRAAEGGCGSDGALARSCHPCPPDRRAPGRGRSPTLRAGGRGRRRRRPAGGQRDGTGWDEVAAPRGRVRAAAAGRAHGAGLLSYQPGTAGRTRGGFFSLSLCSPASCPLPLPFGRAVTEEKIAALPFAARLPAPSGGTGDLEGGFLSSKGGLRCGSRRRPAGPAPGSSFCVRGGLSLALAVNHPGPVSPAREGTAAAASRAPPAGTRRSAAPGLAGSLAAGCRGGAARRGARLPRGARSGAAPAGAGAGSAAGAGSPWRGWCPNSFNHGSSSESFPLHPLFFFFSLLSPFFFFLIAFFLSPCIAARVGCPGEERTAAAGGSAEAAGVRGGGTRRGAPSLCPVRAHCRAPRGDASGLPPEVRSNKKF